MAQRSKVLLPGCLHPGPYTCKASQVKRKGRMQLCQECYFAQRRIPTAKTAPTKTRLLDFIRTHPYATYEEMAAATGVTMRSLPGYLSRMAALKLIRRRLQWEVVE